jgi:hypothetical protein
MDKEPLPAPLLPKMELNALIEALFDVLPTQEERIQPYLDAPKEVSERVFLLTYLPWYRVWLMNIHRYLLVTYNIFEPWTKVHHAQEIFSVLLRYSEHNLKTSRR